MRSHLQQAYPLKPCPGGSSLVYNNVWLDAGASNLLPGQTLSGFDVHVTDAAVPSAVPWFALTTGSIPYTGPGSFTGDPYNPGFEGVAAPEPAACLLLLAGLGIWLARLPHRRECLNRPN